MASTRRLAAIFAADVAGYSRLMGTDEEGTLERLKALRRQLIDPKIAERHGHDGTEVEVGRLAEELLAVGAQRRVAGEPFEQERLRVLEPREEQRTASTTLGNSASRPSPVVLTIRPWRSAIFGSISCRRSALSRSSVPSSSVPIRRE